MDINILNINACWGGIIMSLNGALYTGSFGGSNGLAIAYIGGADTSNPFALTSTVINKTIRITANNQYVHWLGIIYGQITSTIQSIS